MANTIENAKRAAIQGKNGRRSGGISMSVERRQAAPCEQDWAAFGRAVTEATGIQESRRRLVEVFADLPAGIREQGMQWGLGNADFCDAVYWYLRCETKAKEEFDKAHERRKSGTG